MTDDNILARVPKPLLARALKKLPAADIWLSDTAETTIDVPGLGAVRVTAERKPRQGQSAHYFWTAVKAVVAKKE